MKVILLTFSALVILFTTILRVTVTGQFHRNKHEHIISNIFISTNQTIFYQMFIFVHQILLMLLMVGLDYHEMILNEPKENYFF
jgi:hypothetical protein